MSQDTLVEFEDYVGAARRQGRLIATIVAGAVALAVVATFVMPEQYTAESRVLVRPVADPSSASVEEVDIDTERGVARSLAVATIAADNLGTDEAPSDLLDGLSVESVTDSQILVLSYTDGGPRAAFAAADAFAKAYLQFRRQEADAVGQAARQAIQAGRDEAEAEQARLNEALNQGPGESRRAELESDLQVVQSTLSELNRDLEELNSRQVDPGTIIDEAEVPSSPSSPSLLLNVAGAGLIGVIVALCVAFYRERDQLGRGAGTDGGAADLIATATTVRHPPAPEPTPTPTAVVSPQVPVAPPVEAPVSVSSIPAGPPDRRSRLDVEAVLTQAGVAVLGTVPRLTNDTDAPAFDSVTMLAGPVGEQMRVVRSQIERAMHETGVRSLLVTTPEHRGIAVGIAGSLAVTMAQEDRDVLLLAGDVEEPTLHRRFQLNNDQGLLEALRGHRPLAQVMQGWGGYETLVVVTAGQVAEASPDDLTGPRMRSCIDAVRDQFDAIVLETAPVLTSAYTLRVAEACDAALLAVDPRGSRPERILEAADHLRRHTRLLGGVVIEARRRARPAARAPLGLPSTTSR